VGFIPIGMKKFNKKSLLSLLLVLVMLFSQSIVFADAKLPTRAEAEDKYKWDLTEIYKTRSDFEADMKKLTNEVIPKFEQYKGKLNTVDNLLAYFKLDEEASRLLMKGYVYANFSLDLNQADSNAQEMASIAETAYSKYLAATSFEKPEILSLSEEKLKSLMNDPKLKDYKLYLDQLLKQKEHILSAKEEAILSAASDMAGSPKDIFDKATLADYEYPTIKDKNGKDIKLNDANYSKILEEGDRDLRKKAYLARTNSYGKINNTLTATYNAEVKKNIFFANARGYDSSIDAALAEEFIPRSIYDNLVKSVNGNLKYLHKYYEVKKKALGLKELHAYDDSLPLVKDYKMEIPYDEAVKIITKALAPLGDEYVADFKKGVNSRWVDVYADENKYTGGYQWGSYDTHPYILMNYTNDLDSALTLAHEMGHALNTVYSNKTQPYYMSNYPIFTAEVASTANELLVMDYMIKNAKNDNEKLYLLNKQIDNIMGTIYTQVMFSEFEQTVHDMAEKGEPLSADVLNNLWLSLIKKYHGKAFTVDENSKYGWSRIPHFYMNFYVYKYATSMSASYALVNNILEGKEGAVDKYLEFLAAGGSDYPVETLKKAGVDMNSSEPVDSILEYFGELIDEMGKLLEKNAKENKKK
jgi:oligoendopeptidase F